jgi:S1-C subfamily serine protease
VALAALGGGALALAGAAAFGKLGTQKTVREVVAAEASPAVSFRGNGPLSINNIYRRAAPGVVQITSTTQTQVEPDPFLAPFGTPQIERQTALGSGFVIDKAGHIVTNYHVVEHASEVEVSFSNNESLKATIVGVDPATDLAVLKVNAPDRALRPLTLGRSSSVRVGDPVVAIGNPLGFDRSITSGIVSALGRTLEAPSGTSAIDHVIQTDAAINRGNSGGPLLNARGEVIGVNSQISTGSPTETGNIGIGFAIPVDTVKTVVAQLIRRGKVEHAFIGIRATAITPAIARLFHLPVQHGLLVTSVEPGSGAAEAGIKPGTTTAVVDGVSWPLGGDIVTKADGITVASLERLRDIIGRKEPGDSISLEIYRGSEKKTLEVKLGRQPVPSTR